MTNLMDIFCMKIKKVFKILDNHAMKMNGGSKIGKFNHFAANENETINLFDIFEKEL